MENPILDFNFGHKEISLLKLRYLFELRRDDTI